MLVLHPFVALDAVQLFIHVLGWGCLEVRVLAAAAVGLFVLPLSLRSLRLI